MTRLSETESRSTLLSLSSLLVRHTQDRGIIFGSILSSLALRFRSPQHLLVGPDRVCISRPPVSLLKRRLVHQVCIPQPQAAPIYAMADVIISSSSLTSLQSGSPLTLLQSNSQLATLRPDSNDEVEHVPVCPPHGGYDYRDCSPNLDTQGAFANYAASPPLPADKLYLVLDKEMRQSFIGPLSVHSFLQDFLPIATAPPPSFTPGFKKVAEATCETEMYNPFVRLFISSCLPPFFTANHPGRDCQRAPHTL